MATNMYIKFEGPKIETDLTVSGHEKDVEIMSWNHGFSQPTSPVRSSAGAGTVEQAHHMNLSFTKYLDGASADLLKLCWSGKQFEKATLFCYRSDGALDNKAVLYLKVIMEHVIVANVSVSGGPGDIPVENVSLDYGILQYEMIGQKRESGGSGGTKSAKHDLEKRVIS